MKTVPAKFRSKNPMASKAVTHYLQFDIQWYLWTSKFRFSTFLYILCRYALLANVLYLLDIAGKLTENCNTWYQFIGALSVLGRAAVIVVFAGRTWAVWGQNRFVLAYMSILGAACVALDITHVPGLRCTGGSSIPIGLSLRFFATIICKTDSGHPASDLLSILMVVFEYSSAILNSIRCIQAFRAHGKSFEEQKEGFQFLLFEQGIFYFSIVSLFTTAAVILNFQAPSGFFQRLLNALTLPLSGLLTARFLLHMREWEYKNSPGAMSIHGIQNGGPEGHLSATISFRAASVALSTIITSDFGSDPVARGPNPKNSRNRSTGASQSEGNDSIPSTPSTTSHSRVDVESQPHPEPTMKSESSTESVKEGKKRVQYA
ncbi:uncharacterized protein C8R40DRAFT_687047 [Lentinula edodes]|uniref:uncharacterized protein n=1 Tax=Lentinula edodes TaxID=5353 RepID=UPI001E8EADD7|nr:uncharacterized protein C8R40DRAFT_687047 [Lentinula edodes]KAH7878916.1 hypothetical protein C8R40DRAFT_687047 [Lentinula edodes]